MESKQPLRIGIDPKLRRFFRELPKSQRFEVGSLIEKVRQNFGNPHLHTGIGIRKLTGKFYECRWRLATRLVFEKRDSVLYFHLSGNHDEVKRFLSRI